MINRVEKPAVKGTWLGTLLRLLNPFVRFLLASPLHWPLSRWFVLLSWTGEKTGQPRSTPVSYVREGSVVWVTAGDKWTEHVVGNQTLRVRLRGIWKPATAVEVTDPEECRREHVRLFKEHGWFRFLAGIPKRDGKPDEEQLAHAIESGRKLIRIEWEVSQ